MNRNRPTRLLASIFIILALIASGCGGGSKLKPMLTAHDAFEIGKQQYDKKKYLKAVESFQQVVYNYPGDPVVDSAQYYLALSYFGSEDYALASVEFNRLVLNYPGSAYADHAQFLRAVCMYEGTPKNAGLDQTGLPESIQQLEDFIVEHPESELVPDANTYLHAAKNREAKRLYSAAVVYTRMRASEAAKIYYQKVIDDYTSSDYASLASFGIAEEEMRVKAFDEARRRFDNFAIVYSEHSLVPKAKKRSSDAAFHSGETAYKKGDTVTAISRFQTFKTDFPNDRRVRKADQYLQELSGKSTTAATNADAGS